MFIRQIILVTLNFSDDLMPVIQVFLGIEACYKL